MINLYDWLNPLMEEFKSRGIFITSINVDAGIDLIHAIGQLKPVASVVPRIEVEIGILACEENDLAFIYDADFIDEFEMGLVSTVHNVSGNGNDMTLSFFQREPQWNWVEA